MDPSPPSPRPPSPPSLPQNNNNKQTNKHTKPTSLKTLHGDCNLNQPTASEATFTTLSCVNIQTGKSRTERVAYRIETPNSASYMKLDINNHKGQPGVGVSL